MKENGEKIVRAIDSSFLRYGGKLSAVPAFTPLMFDALTCFGAYCIMIGLMLMTARAGASMSRAVGLGLVLNGATHIWLIMNPACVLSYVGKSQAAFLPLGLEVSESIFILFLLGNSDRTRIVKSRVSQSNQRGTSD